MEYDTVPDAEKHQRFYLARLRATKSRKFDILITRETPREEFHPVDQFLRPTGRCAMEGAGTVVQGVPTG